MGYRQEEKELAAINLLEKIMDEQSDIKLNMSKLGAYFTASRLVGHMQRIIAIIGTSGAHEANKKLRASMKELNLEITDEFPHQETIEFLVHDVLNKYYDAVGDHFGEWENAKKNVIVKAFGTYSVFEPELLGVKTFRKRRKKKKGLIREDFEEDD